jgi:hypothetical protein
VIPFAVIGISRRVHQFLRSPVKGDQLVEQHGPVFFNNRLVKLNQNTKVLGFLLIQFKHVYKTLYIGFGQVSAVEGVVEIAAGIGQSQFAAYAAFAEAFIGFITFLLIVLQKLPEIDILENICVLVFHGLLLAYTKIPLQAIAGLCKILRTFF